MTPVPDLQQLIDLIRTDAGSDDVLAQLATASTTITELTDTSDAALGYFVDQARAAGRSWLEISSVLGVSKQAAHKRFADSASAKPSFERFTARTRSVLEAAPGVARQHNHPFVGTEHLLLALYTQPEGVAAKVLDGRGLTEQAVTDAVQAIAPDGSADQLPADDVALPMTPFAVSVLKYTLDEALGLGHNYIGTEHLLLSLYRHPGGVAAQVLQRLGLNGDAAREAVKAALLELMRAK
ncbi:ClpA/ClpB-like protein [Kribbella amoyensis]|uniref:ClpA/ClpB-like protein n=1 Tax=Kribbella amoyensis TaxID=996641 RepID=A0A561BVY2_9ACTN|nr:Clp protease N-terminal domain-containing protein [Kribbella amoyensis]TWD82993.1 ClpA/ClpB-like protein [Kribbella amoyensis]